MNETFTTKKEHLITILKQDGSCTYPENIRCDNYCPCMKKKGNQFICLKPIEKRKEYLITMFLTIYGKKEDLIEILI